jgi:hypothetical protein
MFYQQGDVLIKKIDGIPKDAKKVKAEGERFILARGEATGHHHSVPAIDAELFSCPDGLILHCIAEVQIEHQEHQPITLPIGDYQIIPVQEYDHFKEEARRVVD